MAILNITAIDILCEFLHDHMFSILLGSREYLGGTVEEVDK